jgi:RNA polymerase sigma-70 factor (ECF subfamily)
MSEKAPNQASSKEDLDQLSALEESMAPFGMGDLDSEHGVILKDWSAQDFANIYVRFRPHLISHARKFLREETLAEEVVQDAFLYLMTALPELDSELGVLRFLKWKTKMLCLDIIRSSQAGLNSNLVPLPDDVADETQPLDSLERADDAAIIRLALAKLNPRHREALIATMYEEKSHEEVAQQLGVSVNAFRQLLHRARSSFRQALVGEAEIEGKSVAEILSVAARKAARDSGKWISSAGILVILTFGSIALISENYGSSETASSEIVSATSESDVTDEKPGDSPSQGQRALDLQSGDEVIGPETVEYEATIKAEPVSESETGQTEEPDAASATVADLNETGNRKVSELSGLLTSQLAIDLASELQTSELFTNPNSLVIDSGRGLNAYVAIDSNSDSVIQHLVFEFEIGEHKLTAVPLTSHSVVDRTANGRIELSYAATDFLVGDFAGTLGFDVVDESPFARSGLLIEMVIDELGSVAEASARLLPRT